MKLIKEFKEFINRGNVLDMAVGVIIGGAFSKIVTSLVNDILMPFINLILGGKSTADLQVILKPAIGENEAIILHYGTFIQNIIDFLIIALVIFMVIKAFNTLRRKEEKEEVVETVAAPSEEILLLREIRDHLKK